MFLLKSGYKKLVTSMSYTADKQGACVYFCPYGKWKRKHAIKLLEFVPDKYSIFISSGKTNSKNERIDIIALYLNPKAMWNALNECLDNRINFIQSNFGTKEADVEREIKNSILLNFGARLKQDLGLDIEEEEVEKMEYKSVKGVQIFSVGD